MTNIAGATEYRDKLIAFDPVGHRPSDGSARLAVAGARVDMNRHQVARHIPVIQDGKTIGIVGIGDLVKFRLLEKPQEIWVLQDFARACVTAA